VLRQRENRDREREEVSMYSKRLEGFNLTLLFVSVVLRLN